jgi:phosphatidylglycerophosphate synthase
LQHAQKPGHGVPAYTRWVNRRAARFLAAAFALWGLTPSTVSVISILVSIAGLTAFLGLHSVPLAAGFVAAILLALGYALDSADGQLARLQGSSSLRGEWLDHTLDAVRLPLIHLSVAAGCLIVDRTALAVVAAGFSVIASASFLSQNLGGLLRDKSTASRVHVRRFQSWLLLPTDSGVLCWMFVLWPVSALFTTAYAALFVLNLGLASVAAGRRWAELGAAS